MITNDILIAEATNVDRTQFLRDAESSLRCNNSEAVNNFLDGLCQHRAYLELRDQRLCQDDFWNAVDQKVVDLQHLLKAHGYYRKVI